MKIRCLLAIVGLAIGFVVPAFAQQKDTADPEITQKICAISKGYDEAANNNNAPESPRFFTEDAVLWPTVDQSTVGKQSRNGMKPCSSKCISQTISARPIKVALTLKVRLPMR
jgi:hypothetical protein